MVIIMKYLSVDFKIPKELHEEIELLVKAVNNGKLYDCELSNLLAGINASEICGEINNREARILRKYYIEGEGKTDV